MERERKGARLQQKADGRARQRGETSSLTAHPLKKKKCLWRVGVWRDPFSWGLNRFFFGSFAVPHPSPATKRKSSLSLLIEMQEPRHPHSSRQAPARKVRGPAEPSTHRRLGTAEVHLQPGSGGAAVAPLCPREGEEKKIALPPFPPNYPLARTRHDSPRGDEHPGLGNGQALEVVAVQGAKARTGCLATAGAGGAGVGAGRAQGGRAGCLTPAPLGCQWLQ